MPDIYVGAAQEIRLIRPIRPMSKQCAAIFYPRVLTALVFTRTANFGGADVRQVGQVRQVGHQTAAPSGCHTAAVILHWCITGQVC